MNTRCIHDVSVDRYAAEELDDARNNLLHVVLDLGAQLSAKFSWLSKAVVK